MKYILLLISILLCGGVYAENTIKWESDAPKTKVKATGRFSKTKAPKLINSKYAPEGTYAKALAVDHYQFEWRPRWNFVGMGGVLLPFVLESPDQSALGIVETLPQKDAPSSSILVFMNLYNLRVINYLVMTGKDVRKFCFVPFSGNVVCLIKSPYDKYYPEPKFQLQTMDTHAGIPVSVSPVFKKEITTFCCSPNGSKLFVAFKDSNEIRIYNTNELSKSFKVQKTVKSPVSLDCTANGKRLIVTGSEKMQAFNVEQDIVVPEYTINLPQYFHPDKVVLCADDGSSFLLSRFGDDTYFYINREFTRLCKLSEVDVNWSIADQSILVGLPKKSTVAIYSPDGLEEPKKQFSFLRIRPRTSGKLYKIICLPNSGRGVVIMDNFGGMARISPKRHSWQKEIIINQPKPE
jgi:hypothetical protein